MTEEAAISPEGAETKVEDVIVQVDATTDVSEVKTDDTVTVESQIAPPEPKKKTAQERIDEITRARREAEREREYWKQVALGKTKEEKPPESEIAPGIPPRPRIENFDTMEEYEDALFAWRDQKKEIGTKAVRQKTEQEEALKTFNQRAKKLREENEDFDEIIEAPVFSPIMRMTILHSENGPALAYFLGKLENRDTTDRIRSLPSEMQPYELGRLETKLLLAQNTKKVPGAPPPIKPVGMAGGGEIDPSKLSTEEWMAWDKARTIERLKQKAGG